MCVCIYIYVYIYIYIYIYITPWILLILRVTFITCTFVWGNPRNTSLMPHAAKIVQPLKTASEMYLET